MAIEKTQLMTRDGRVIEAEAEITRYGSGARMVRGGGVVVVFFMLAAIFVFVPGLHLVTTWFLPLLGLGLGAYIGRVSLWVGEVSGECPDCNKAMVIGKSGPVAADEALWLRCPHCTLPLELSKELPR
jgi:hypothetical protein